ncbi:MAG: tRNA (N6-isopentenyl adenosine(37)-C2)-methylthiotransferase MiaB [Phycisphaerae bacterium]|nr:tRNA (N6-isopentenyl adenosine(37)-C2)-methylthiotransferase MiaB [Phycisphaerae bacterium]
MTSSKTVYLETMGCQMNALDSELVLCGLVAEGYRLTNNLNAADLVILNTCSVRQHAEDKVYSRLGQLKGAQARNPDQIVAVIGCMAERDGDGLLAKMPRVLDILCGPKDLHRLLGLIADVRQHRKPAIALSGRLRDRSTPPRDVGPYEDVESLDSRRFFGLSSHAPTPKVFGRHQAYVRITRGCNKYCTYCVVPYTRGPEEHRPPERIVDDVRRLADNGVAEVTLLGQTVNHYHYRPDRRGEESQHNDTTFAQLLRRIHDEVPRLPRLRFVTSFPRDFTDETLEVMASSPRICRYLHLPAQSGSDRILKRMNRGYTVEQYRVLLDRAREWMPDICLAGDMIVGFSGETEEDFERSVELLRYARYKNCFVFKYSPRPGTLADARLPDDVPDEVKRQRNNEMLAVQTEIGLANHRAMIGEIVDVLIEGPSKSAAKAQGSRCARGERVEPQGSIRSQLVGRTRGDQIVVLNGTPDMIGRILSVRITAAMPYTMRGEACGVDSEC